MYQKSTIGGEWLESTKRNHNLGILKYRPLVSPLYPHPPYQLEPLWLDRSTVVDRSTVSGCDTQAARKGLPACRFWMVREETPSGEQPLATGMRPQKSHHLGTSPCVCLMRKVLFFRLVRRKPKGKPPFWWPLDLYPARTRFGGPDWVATQVTPFANH